MRDNELMDTVEAFGQKDSPIRLLLCSDVAAEGINLHHLSHRMIHFDIPWSLMVFQQRNGRIDRYGQTLKPQIRYLMTLSEQPEVRGDQRILEILIEKDEQAGRNIGDPSEFLGVFSVEEEEAIVAQAMEHRGCPTTATRSGNSVRIGGALSTSTETLNVNVPVWTLSGFPLPSSSAVIVIA